MTYPTAATPRHFSGELISKALGSGAGLRRMEVHLVGHAGERHIIYIAYGRGEAAAAYSQQQYDLLRVGTWYSGSATMMLRSTGQTEWGGHVPPLLVCKHRHRFATTAIFASAAMPAATV